MDGEFWINVLMRWLHVAAAVTAVGGTLLVRFVLLPALAVVPNGAQVLDAIRPGLKRLIHGAIGLLLLTGLYNYMVVSIPKVRSLVETHPEMRSYHPVMGIKILLSLVLFGLAFALLKPVPSFHENRKGWLSVNAVLGLTILLLAAYLRRLWP